MTDIEYIIEMALSHHRSGRLSEAEKIYTQVLEIDPKQPDAIHLLGMVAFARKNYDEAVRFVNAAIIKSDRSGLSFEFIYYLSQF